MQAKYLKEMEVIPQGAPKALLDQCVERPERSGRWFGPAGTLVDHPDCWRLVLMGVAEAADDECRAMTQQTADQLAQIQHAAARLSAGIAPEDFHLFDAKYIAGYNADGSYKPGENWAEYEKIQTEQKAKQDEDI